MPAATNTQKAVPYQSARISQIASGTSSSRSNVIRLGMLNSSSAPAEPAPSADCVGNSGRGAASGTMTAADRLMRTGAGARQSPARVTPGITVHEIKADAGERRFQLVDAAEIIDFDRRLLP